MSYASDYAKQIAYSSQDTLLFTYNAANMQADTRGCYVECGVAAGAQIIAMADAAPRKKIYAFDSFQGIPLPSNRDNQYPGIRFISEAEQKTLPNPGEQILESSGATVVSEETFWEHIEKSGVFKDNIITVPGWFEETTPKFKEPIALLRLDGDLYNSTKVCLENLYPLVVPGGMVIIDDFALPGCSAAVREFEASIKESFNMHLIKGQNYTIAYWIK